MSDAERQIILLSLGVASASVALLLPFAVGAAWALSRSWRGKSIFEALVTAPLVLPPVVTGYLLLLVLGRRGPIGALLHDTLGVSLAFNPGGAAVAAAVVSFPLAVRAIRLSFEAVDPKLLDAAATLGAGRLATLFRVSLPLAIPGVITGALLAFARSLGEFGATITFAGNVAGRTRTLPLAIYSALQRPEGEAIAARLVVVSVLLALAALVTSELLVRRHR